MKDSTSTEGTATTRALELAEEIRQTGRRSPQELVPLISQAEQLAHDASGPFTRGVYVRAAGSAHQMLNKFTAALEHFDSVLACFNEAGEYAHQEALTVIGAPDAWPRANGAGTGIVLQQEIQADYTKGTNRL